MARRISILLPIYNERDNIVPLLDEIAAALKPLKERFEVIAVDDGSRDGSAEVLRAEAASRSYLRVILFLGNAGQTAALDAGFRHATGDVIVTLDADRQNDPSDIPALLDKLEEGYDCVTGWRMNRQDGFWLRKVPSKAANFLIRRLWRSEVRDLGCALKVYRREIIGELRLYGEMHRFIAIILESVGARVAQLPVKHRPRAAGRSKYSLTRVFKVVVDLMTLWFLQRFRTKPIHVFGALALGCFVLAGLSSAIVIEQKLTEDFSINRNPLFTLVVFLGGIGVQFVTLGLVAELLIRVWFESGNRAPYSIRTKIGFERTAKALPRSASA